MNYRLRDWAWKIIGEGKIDAGGTLVLKASDPVFQVELERP
jgi:hypothetical protein